MSVDDCTPEARITKSLLGYGVIAGPFYVIASVAHGLLRPGFDFRRDSWSLLSVGPHGWVHVVVFIVTGLMVAAAGVGLRRHVRGAAGPSLVVYGALLVLAGLAKSDLPGAGLTTHGLLHLAAGGLGFVAFAVAALSGARRFGRKGNRPWALWSVVAGVGLISSFAGVATDSSSTAMIVIFTAAVVLSWIWLTTTSIHHYREAALEGVVAGPASSAAVL